MKKILALFAVLGLLTATASGAWAFTKEKADVNPDGTEKYTDPDEQMPAFVTSPGDSSGAATTLDEDQVTPRSYGDVNEGAQDFDRDTAHMENSH